MKGFTKNIFVIFIIALAHFGASKAVVAVALDLSSGKAVYSGVSVLIKSLVWITRILYFPIISFSLYSREWFPGKLIDIPIFVNSLLWAITIYFSAIVCSRLFRSKNRRPPKG